MRGNRSTNDSVPLERRHSLVRVPPSSRRTVARAVRLLSRTLRNWFWRRRLAGFGARSRIDPPAFVWAGRSIVIGRDVHIWRYARLEPVNATDDTVRIAIGEGTVIHPYVHIGAVKSVRIGQHVLIASHVYITDHDHDWSDPDDPVISNRRLLVAPTSIGDYVWLGEHVMVLKGVTIGERSIVGAGSVVTRDIPAYSLAVGAPARVVRRYDRELRAWVTASTA